MDSNAMNLLDVITKWHVIDVAVLVVGFLLTLYLIKKYKVTSYVSFITYIPSIWTSLGILGTFISIFLSLTILEFNSLEDISRLVNMVAPAFSTSIIGIVGALISSIVVKVHRANLEVGQEEQYLAVIRNIEMHVGNMRANILEMASEIGRELLKSASGEMRQVLIRHVEAVTGTLQRTEQKLDAVAGQIVAGVDRVASEYNSAIKKLLDEYGKEARQIKECCDVALEHQQEYFRRHTEEQTARQLETLAEIDSNIRSSVERAFGELLGGIDELTQAMSDVQIGMREVSDASSGTRESMTLVKMDFEVARKEFISLMSDCRRSLEEVSNELTNSINIGRDNTVIVEGLLIKAQNMTTRLDEVVVSIGIAVSKLTRSLEDLDVRTRERSIVGRPSLGSVSRNLPDERHGIVPPRSLRTRIKDFFTVNKQN